MGNVTTILGGSSGPWRVTSMAAVIGVGLPPVDAIAVAETPPAGPTPPGAWRLRGVGSTLCANDSETLSPREFCLEGAEG